MQNLELILGISKPADAEVSAVNDTVAQLLTTYGFSGLFDPRVIEIKDRQMYDEHPNKRKMDMLLDIPPKIKKPSGPLDHVLRKMFNLSLEAMRAANRGKKTTFYRISEDKQRSLFFSLYQKHHSKPCHAATLRNLIKEFDIPKCWRFEEDPKP